MLETTESGVHWRVRPREAVSAGTGTWRARVRWPLADQRPSITEEPAQLRTSWAKREGSEDSWGSRLVEEGREGEFGGRYNHAPVDANYVVEPWLDGELEVGVAQDLEAETAVGFSCLGRRITVETGYESVEGVEHVLGGLCGGLEVGLSSF